MLIRLLFVTLMLLSVQSWAAIDAPKQVLIMMTSHGSAAKAELLLELSEDQPFELTYLIVEDELPEQLAGIWEKMDLVLLDGMNPELAKSRFGKYDQLPSQFPYLKIASLGDIDNPTFNQNLTEEQYQLIGQYFNNAGRKNYRNLMVYISSDVFQLRDEQVELPAQIPLTGLYHPKFKDGMTDNEVNFFNWLATTPEQVVIGVAIHRSVIDYEQQQIVDALINGIEEKGHRAFGFYFEGNDEALNYTDLLLDDNQQSRIHLMINYRSLHYVEKRRGEFDKIGVPVIHALNFIDGSIEEFNHAQAGISPNMTPFFLVMPEDTGSTDPVIIAANENDRRVVLPAQMNALIERAINHALLSITDNKDKKVAAFIWNYPPGEKNVGAAFLDVPSSLVQIATAMQQAGYQIKQKSVQAVIDDAGKLLRPHYRTENASSLIEEDLADYLPLSTYLNWFEQLPDEIQQQINQHWGKPLESSMLYEHQGKQVFIIPRMSLGNLIVMPQGGRSDNIEDHAKLYHDMATPINHGYLAIYLYAKEVFKASAIIHLGTHGSLEWLLGKERGLSVYDSPSLAAGNLPVFYPYIIDNVGEAMQAKRRGRATMISHLTPGFAKAGFYAEISELNDLIGNYLMLDQGQTKQNTKKRIEDLVAELNLLEDLDLTATTFSQQFDQSIANLQDRLNDMAQQAQPLGIHIFGLLPKDSHIYSTILQMLGNDFAIEAKKYEQQHGLSLSEDVQQDSLNVTQLDALDGFQLLQAYLENKPLPGLPDSLQTQLVTAQEYWRNFRKIAETENLIAALSAKYIPVSYGGDPIRNPQVVPTGRNLIGFNPAKVPSKEAYQAGINLMEQTINDYRVKHGNYPEKLAFSLWSLETMRHHGALESQILYALGVEPEWDHRGQISGTKIIPMNELKRPRIDVVVSATGLYRDAFPNVMLWMAEAIDKVAKMKEENNFVYRNSAALRQRLIDQGRAENDADYLSSIRIFSNDSGSYGTGLASATLDSGSWETDAAMSDTYLKRMGYAYGSDENRWSDKVNDIDLYGEVLSGTEAVIFSRSTKLYALLTNDDPFQYFGGIAQAVRNIDGKTPQMYISNLRRKDDIKTQTIENFFNNEMRSRYFHPRWIQSMQESGYAGAIEILDRMNNMWGWEVMTPELVRDDHWQEFFEVYIADKYKLDIKEFFEQSNAHALAQILERMLEANRKDYWQADIETLKEMLKTYVDLANRYDVVTNNEKFNEFVSDQAAGFGLESLTPELAMPDAKPASGKTTQQITGQKLEQVTIQKIDNMAQIFPWLVLVFIFLLGVFRSLKERQSN